MQTRSPRGRPPLPWRQERRPGAIGPAGRAARPLPARLSPGRSAVLTQWAMKNDWKTRHALVGGAVRPRHSNERPSGRLEMPTPGRPPRCEESMSGTVVPRPALCALHAGICSPGRGACRDPALSEGLSRDSNFPPAPLRALSRCCVVLCARLLCARFYYYLGYSTTGGLRFRISV